MVNRLKYGHTNTFFIRGTSGGLLVDTDYAGTLPLFYKELNMPIKEKEAVLVKCKESRTFLHRIGIEGEIMSTPSHSNDSVSLILDNGTCFVGDLEPINYLDAYEENLKLKEDWKLIMSYDPKIIYYAHANEKRLI